MGTNDNREGAEILNEAQDSASLVLRIALDADASLACDQMTQVLRAEGSVRLSPSRFVSYVVARFASLYFEKDKELLLGEFFDFKGFVEGELKKATDSSEVSAILERAMLKVRKMQEIKKRGTKVTARKIADV